MNSSLLLPNRWKRIGWIILIPATVAGILLITTGFGADWLHMKMFAIVNDDISLFNGDVASKGKYFVWADVGMTNTLVGIAFIAGAMIVAFSKEKQEDEFIANLRLSSLMWSVWVSYILLLLGFLFIYGTAFLNVMIYNMFTVLIIFISRFNYILYKTKKAVVDEK
ncbi:MAG TPA: hypothetical protein VJ508_03430 [Saprospiraceae bacterium]|nr:hypothetical protein [Saprospiraceae bacterium]